MRPIDVLIIGGGPAGLAVAIRLKQKMNQARKDFSVVVVDKAPKMGAHSLSGSVFEPACLDELLPGWQMAEGSIISEMQVVERDEMYFLTPRSAFQIPPALVPAKMHHKGDRIVSLARLVDWLGREARKVGVEVHTGFSAASLVWEGRAVKGVKLVDQGKDRDGAPKANFLKGESIQAKVTVLADGPKGVLSREYASIVGGNVNPQVYSIGIKQILRLPEKNGFGTNRAVHTLGFPNHPDVFGGGFFYSMENNLVAAGIILGLDWLYTDLNPQQEFELLKTHPFVAGFLKGAQVVAAGAKTIPEGGFFSMPKLWTGGALIVGDAAGFVNMEKIKGIHYGILSGMAAADAIMEVLDRNNDSDDALATYEGHLNERGVLADMRHARNFRQSFQWGLYAGMPLSQCQSLLPFRLGIQEDHARTRMGRVLQRNFKPAVDRSTFAALSNTSHREDEPSHLLISDRELCRRCQKEFASPCTVFCPTEVYRRKEETIGISASNCVHCGTCSLKCPYKNIVWLPPEGGEGPRYKLM